jgi:threonine aldolase
MLFMTLSQETQSQKDDRFLVPSGTMGNLIAVLAHCWGRGNEVLLGDQSHIHIYEQGGIAQVRSNTCFKIIPLSELLFSLAECIRAL